MNENMALLIVFEFPKTLYKQLRANIKGLSIDEEGEMKVVMPLF